MYEEKPRPQGFDGVTIGIPLPHSSYSDSPSETSVDKKHHYRPIGFPPSMVVCKFLLFLSAILVGITVLTIFYLNKEDPSFKVESASVFFYKTNSNNDSSSDAIAAEWNIGLSIHGPGEFSNVENFDSDGLKVFFRYNVTTQDWLTAVVGSSNEDAENMSSLNATVNTLLPQGISFEGSTWEFEVMVRVRLREQTIEATCKNMGVRFSLTTTATSGIMVGGPRICPASYIKYHS